MTAELLEEVSTNRGKEMVRTASSFDFASRMA
jgi:hypothetical protein